MRSQPVYKCPSCSRRVKRSPYIALTDRRSRRERRFHGAPHFACLEAGLDEAHLRGPTEIILRFAHPRSCGDPAGKLECRGGCFQVDDEAA
jgi:hypothetical protein